MNTETSSLPRKPDELLLEGEHNTEEGVRSDIRHNSPDYAEEFPEKGGYMGREKNKDVAHDMANAAKPHIDSVLKDLSNGKPDARLVGRAGEDSRLVVGAELGVTTDTENGEKFTSYKELRAKVSEGYSEANKIQEAERVNSDSRSPEAQEE